MRNEKGSVLSVAIIVVMLLSFSITTITAYTQNVVTRTNTTIAVRDDEMIADTLLRLAMRDFTDTIQASEYSTFEEMDDHNVISDLIDRIFEDYDVEISERQSDDSYTSGGYFTREYRFSYYIDSLDQTLYRNLIVSVELTTVEGRDYRNIFDEENGIINKYLENFNIEGNDKIYCHPDYTDDEVIDEDKCRDDLLNDIATTGGSGNNQLMSGDFYIGSDFEAEGSNQASIDLNNNVFIIDGDFDLGALRVIENGLVIVTGDLFVSSSHGVTINNVLFLVQGDINISYTHNNHGTLEGTNFVMLGYSGSSVVASASDENKDYYLKTITNLPGQNIEYVGSDPYTDIEKILDDFLSDLPEDVSYIYEFFY